MAFVAPLLPAITLAATAASGVLAYGGAKEASQATANMYNYQSAVAQNNAQIAARNAQTELGVGEEKALQAGMAGRQRIGAIRAAIGASGVDVDSGSASDVVAGQKLAEDKNQGIIRETAGRKAYDFETQATGDIAQASLDELGAQQSLQAGEIKGIGSLIGSAASVSDKWMNLNKLGVI